MGKWVKCFTGSGRAVLARARPFQCRAFSACAHAGPAGLAHLATYRVGGGDVCGCRRIALEFVAPERQSQCSYNRIVVERYF